MQGAWVCQEQKHKTTCEFYRAEIIEALNESAPWCGACKSYHCVPVDRAQWEALRCFDKWED